MSESSEEINYRLGVGEAKSGLWLSFTPTGGGLGRSWQMQVASRGRGGKTLATLLQTTALRPLATVTTSGQSYPLAIGWHERRRGGVVCLGGERKLGQDAGQLRWEMRWTPEVGDADRGLVEVRVAATPRRSGDLHLSLHVPQPCPDVWSLGAAAVRGHCAQVVHSAYSRHAVQFATLEAEAGWDAGRGVFDIVCRRFPFGGGKVLRFGIGFCAADTPEEARGALVAQYVSLADVTLHPLADLPPWQPAQAAARLADPCAYATQGVERMYLRLGGEEAFQAGFPHYPLEALVSLWDWHRFHPMVDVPRLVRYGATGVAADFQVMGREGQSEPNKGAFWDQRVGGAGADHVGAATHGIASNARIARSLFLLDEAVGNPLLRQSALNICQWLILKMNGDGFFDGARVQATRGLPDDGRVVRQPCALDGVEAIRPFVLAFRATRNEVFIKTAWKVAHHLLQERGRDFEGAAPPTVAAAVLALAALDGEAPNAKLRAALTEWGVWLRALPLRADAPALSADGLHAGLYECAQAGLALYGILRDPACLRYAFSALSLVPAESRARSWRDLAIFPHALLSLAALLPQARVDFDGLRVAVDWRVYAPDAATDAYVRVQAPDGGMVHCLPLVSRGDDQLLLIVLAPRGVERVTVFKNGRRPLVRDLRTGLLDSEAALQPLAGEDWARVGLFTVDP